MKHKAPLTQHVIRQHCGDLPEWKVLAIEDSGGTLQDLEVALAWAAGESDVMGKMRRPLTGPASQIFETLMADQEQWDDR